jgi:NADH:ubiquinone reductase (H+-translocating)
MTRATALPSIAVLGGGYAGALAALDLARRLRGAAKVVLVDARPALVERIRLHQLAAGGTLVQRPYAKLLEGTGVRFVQAHVTAVELERKRLRIDDDALPFDRLLLAAGSGPATPTDGARAHAHTLADPQCAMALHAAIERASQSPGSRVAIVGGGVTAIELAFELAHAHATLDVALVSPTLDLGLGEAAQATLERRLIAAGITHVRERVVDVTPAGPTLERGALAAAVTVWAAGFRASPLGAQAGLEVDGHGRVLVDAELRSRSHPDVFLAGDLALPPASVGAPVLMSCRLALPMGLRAAANLAAELAGRSPRPWQCRDSLRCISLGRRDGLIQPMHGDGHPTGLHLRGRPGALVKEAVCRGTVGIIGLYRRLARR